MKIIDRLFFLLVLFVSVTACSQVAVNSSVIATESVETALVHAETPSPLPVVVVITPSITPATTPLSEIVHPPDAQLEHAMLIAPQVYNRLPYMSEFGPIGGDYSGCADTFDFHNTLSYRIEYPLDTITAEFDEYFQQEKWAFTEATTDVVNSRNLPEVSYDTYRILLSDPPAFERLQITLFDESSLVGKDSVYVHIALTHIETKSHLEYLVDFYCGFNNHWQWIRLGK